MELTIADIYAHNAEIDVRLGVWIVIANGPNVVSNREIHVRLRFAHVDFTSKSSGGFGCVVCEEMATREIGTCAILDVRSAIGRDLLAWAGWEKRD